MTGLFTSSRPHHIHNSYLVGRLTYLLDRHTFKFRVPISEIAYGIQWINGINVWTLFGTLTLQISPGSTADELSNEDDYPLFLRTVHTESNEAMAITGVIKAMGWTYVSVVHSGRTYFIAYTDLKYWNQLIQITECLCFRYIKKKKKFSPI